MMNIDATFEMVSARQADLRLLAGPQPMIPFIKPPFDSLRQRLGQAMATLGTMLGVTRPARPTTDGRAPA